MASKGRAMKLEFHNPQYSERQVEMILQMLHSESVTGDL